MWEILTGVLAGLAFGPQVGGPEDVANPNQIAGFMLAIDPAAFLPLEQFTARVDALIDQIHAAPRAPGVDRVYAPGERGYLLAAEREQHGIPLSPRRVAELEAIAESAGPAATLGTTDYAPTESSAPSAARLTCSYSAGSSTGWLA